jgi:hypothetical protein
VILRLGKCQEAEKYIPQYIMYCDPDIVHT